MEGPDSIRGHPGRRPDNPSHLAIAAGGAWGASRQCVAGAEGLRGPNVHLHQTE